MNKPSINGVTSKRHEKQSISLRDIARELDISHATVSLALRSNPRISAVTQIRVKEKADEMGYHPDPMLSALSHYRKTCKERPRQAILAWIHSTTSYRQEEFNLYWEGAKAAALELGFRLEEFQLEGSSLKQLDAILKYRNIHGLVVAPVDNCLTSEQWSEFPWKDYSAIRFGRSLFILLPVPRSVIRCWLLEPQLKKGMSVLALSGKADVGDSFFPDI